MTGLAEEDLEPAVWRFHLHPGVKASLARDRKSVILLLPSKEGWRFKSNCPELTLEKSIYCGALGAPAASEQIVIYGRNYAQKAAPALKMKWALKRLDAV